MKFATFRYEKAVSFGIDLNKQLGKKYENLKSYIEKRN